MAEFATGLLNGADLLNKHTDGALQATSEFSTFVKKLSKLESKFGQELSALVAKDGRKLLDRDALHGFVALVCALTIAADSGVSPQLGARLYHDVPRSARRGGQVARVVQRNAAEQRVHVARYTRQGRKQNACCHR